MTAIADRDDREWQRRAGGEASPEGAPPTLAPAPRPAGLRFWKELLYVLIFYGIYTVIRDTQGQASVSQQHAFHNAQRVIHAERAMWIFHEADIQHRFLSWHWLIRSLDVFYGSAHFIITAVALIWLFRKMPQRYPLWRNTLALTTALALVGFAFFPLMPPRLLSGYSGYFGPHFADTLRTVGGLWNFDSGTMQKLSNQYAAMPSLHFAWSSWCVCVLWPGIRNRAGRVLLICYPLATLFCIVVTGNHYFLDAVGGAAVLAVGYALACALARVTPTRRQVRAAGRSAGPSSGRSALSKR
jgi:hypothetical protein